MFDNYTKTILMEALDTKPTSPTKVSGKPYKKVKKTLKSYGIGSPGPSGVQEVSPLKATQSQILYGTHIKDLPPGTDFDQQATWGFYKNVVTKMIDGITYGTMKKFATNVADDVAKTLKLTGNNAISMAADAAGGWVKHFFDNPVTQKGAQFIEFQAKQKLKTMLAQNYLGKETGAIQDTGDLASKMALGMNDVIQKGLFGDKPLNLNNFGGKQRFGKIGLLVADKLPKLAAMGIDPLDWATKTFGADDAYAAYAEIPEKTRGAALSAGGYLGKGIKQGIY